MENYRNNHLTIGGTVPGDAMVLASDEIFPAPLTQSLYLTEVHKSYIVAQRIDGARNMLHVFFGGELRK
jgi:hypothetical protein